LGYFFPQCKFCIILTKDAFGYIVGAFLKTHLFTLANTLTVHSSWNLDCEALSTMLKLLHRFLRQLVSEKTSPEPQDNGSASPAGW
jgi:hypothetical protein